MQNLTTMPLTRLCFILPADPDDTHKQPRAPSSDTSASVRHRITALLRRSLHWFCHRRWHSFCRCFPDDDHGSSRFEDMQGVDDGSKKHVCGSNPRIFSYAELYIGTNGFTSKELLGSGGFGRVYRAVLPSDGTVVAVKRVSDRGDRFEKAIAAELAAVAQLRHRNLVSLRGWCVHDHQLLLVYDYMPNGSLDRHLFAPSGSGASKALDWERRWNIITGLAASLFYLHEQLDTQIIHRDVKASNVMLDGKYNAKLGDFGLARWLEHSEMSTATSPSSMRSAPSMNHYRFRLTETSRIGGTIGYLPPETFKKHGGSATVKHDVFSFGVVVLEVATGRRAVDLTYPDEEIFMLDWVRRLSDEGNLLNAVDQRFFDGPNTMAQRLLRLGLHCTLHDPQFRPTMKWVIERLTSGDLSREFPALPLFHSQPLYHSLSPVTTVTITAPTATDSSNYVTAAGSTVFYTADKGGGGSGNSGRYDNISSLPTVETPREIPLNEIIAITNSFSDSNKVAELDFGTGYHGYLDNRFRVLVKRLGVKTCPALRSRFTDELHNLARLRHRHLVQLRGWCTEHGEMLVVYDYSSTSLLSGHLFNRNRPVLSWRHRYNIVKCLASAVLYLHEEWEEKVIHRNITSSAVLLDTANDMNPRLGSFALAQFLSRNVQDNPHVSKLLTPPRGIFGYMAPEYMETGEATTMADVYSFGVVVLEVVTGVMAVDFRSPEVLLVRRVRGMEARLRGLEEMVDPRLDERYDGREMVRMVKLGMACTRSDPGLRPSMKQIVRILDGNDELLEMVRCKRRKGREVREGRNAAAMSLVRRIQALGIN